MINFFVHDEKLKVLRKHLHILEFLHQLLQTIKFHALTGGGNSYC